MADKLTINGTEYFKVVLGMQLLGSTKQCIVFTTDPGGLQYMVDSTARKIAEENAEKTLNELISKKVANFLKSN